MNRSLLVILASGLVVGWFVGQTGQPAQSQQPNVYQIAASDGRIAWRVNTFTGEVAICLADSRVSQVFDESGLGVIPKRLVLCVKGEDYKPR
ncbi:MAG: hypothetical protein HY246_24150 [Proteobacteria bacterium]|nr:hypothetical protein [Pseudomonadota bacterium]